MLRRNGGESNPFQLVEALDLAAPNPRTGISELDRYLAEPNDHLPGIYHAMELSTDDLLEIETPPQELLGLPPELFGRSVCCMVLLFSKVSDRHDLADLRSWVGVRLLLLWRLTFERKLGRLSGSDARMMFIRFASTSSKNLEILVELLDRSLSPPIDASLRAVLESFAETTPVTNGIPNSSYCRSLVRLEHLLGRDPSKNPVLNATQTVIEEATRHYDTLLSQSGPLVRDVLSKKQPISAYELPELRRTCQERADRMSPKERGQFAIEVLRLWNAAHRDKFWRSIPTDLTEHGLPFHPAWMDWYNLWDISAVLRRKMDLSPMQAVTILELFLPNAVPGMSVPFAKRLAKSLPAKPWTQSNTLPEDVVERIERKGWHTKEKSALIDAILGKPSADSSEDLTHEKRAGLVMARNRIVAVGTALSGAWIELGSKPTNGGGLGDWSSLNQQIHPLLPEIEFYIRLIFHGFLQDLDFEQEACDVIALLNHARQNLLRIENGVGTIVTQNRIIELVEIATKLQPSRTYPDGGTTYFRTTPEITRENVVRAEHDALQTLDRQMAMLDRIIKAPDTFKFELSLAPAESATRPSAKWVKDLAARMSTKVQGRILQRLAEYEVVHAPVDYLARRTDAPASLEREEQRIIRGLVWAAHLCPPKDAGPIIVDLVMNCFVTVPNVGIKAEKLGNAGLWCLEALPDGRGAPYLARILARTKYPKVRKKIDAALNRAAEAAGMTRTELDELTVPDHGLADGVRRVELAKGAALLTMKASKVLLGWEDDEGAARKAPPKSVKEADPDGVKAIRPLIKEIEKDLAAQSARIQSLYLKQIDWSYDTWLQRYVNHGTMSVLTRRLLWCAVFPDRMETVLPAAGGCVDREGNVVDCSNARMTLWHPLDSSDEDVQAWRLRLIELDIQQPFKQVWRETYQLTDAERRTETYSNRFAGHILKQHQMMTLAHINGWRCTHRMWVDAPNDEPSHIKLPEFGLYAEFWTEGAGDEDPPVLDSGAYIYLATDRIKFCRLDQDRRFGRGEAVPLESVHPRVFSELMRHCDLFTSVASISLDPEWIDRGANAYHPNQWQLDVANAYWNRSLKADLVPSGEIRKQILSEILPRLSNADAFSLEKNHLRVKGVKNEYLIHLGSAGVLMQPMDRHICIVRAGAGSSKVFLPFEGDQMLSLILSKALMLARDDKITDPVILQQL